MSLVKPWSNTAFVYFQITLYIFLLQKYQCQVYHACGPSAIILYRRYVFQLPSSSHGISSIRTYNVCDGCICGSLRPLFATSFSVFYLQMFLFDLFLLSIFSVIFYSHHLLSVPYPCTYAIVCDHG